MSFRKLQHKALQEPIRLPIGTSILYIIDSLVIRRTQHILSLVTAILASNTHPLLKEMFQSLPDDAAISNGHKTRISMCKKRFSCLPQKFMLIFTMASIDITDRCVTCVQFIIVYNDISQPKDECNQLFPFTQPK